MKITIETDDQRKLETLIEWLQTNKFLDEITVNVESNNAKPVITKGDKQVDPTALFGIWKDSPRTLDEIREEAWGSRL